MGILRWIRKRLGYEDEVFLRVPLEGIEGKLFASPMPFGPYDKFNQCMKRYREEGIEFAVSLVTDEEIARKAKRDLLGQYAQAGIESIRFPIRDLTSPPVEDVRELVDRIGPYLRAGAKIAIHCNAGTGRTAVVIACLCADLLNLGGREAIDYVQSLMATQVTESQKRVVRTFADGHAD
jgi:protein-tyrosine phosphatase